MRVGEGAAQADPASGYQSIVLPIAQPHWGERPFKIIVLHDPAVLEPEAHQMIWRPEPKGSGPSRERAGVAAASPSHERRSDLNHAVALAKLAE